MNEGEPLEFAVKGVVRNGQVVLDAALDVPDGTLVTVKDYHESDYPPVFTPPTDEQLRFLKEDITRLRAKAAERDARSAGGQEAA